MVRADTLNCGIVASTCRDIPELTRWCVCALSGVELLFAHTNYLPPLDWHVLLLTPTQTHTYKHTVYWFELC